MLTLGSDERGGTAVLADAFATIDRREWRTVFLERVDADDIPVMAALLRPLGWLGERGVGNWVELDLPETGYTGRYRITAIGSCPEIEVGPGRVVTGLFRRGRSRVFDLWVAGESRPLGGTAKHPVWSVDRNDWVPVGDLRLGERLKTLSGTAAVERVESAGEEPVFTIEVEGDHCYRIGEQGILVHNASACPQQPNITDKTNEFFSRAYDYRKAESLLSPERAFYKNIAILKYNDGSGSKYEPFQNTDLLHSEGELATWLKNKGFGTTGNEIVIEAIFSERQPCSNCQDIIKDLCSKNCAPFNVYYLINYPIPNDNKLEDSARAKLIMAYSVAGLL